MNIQIWSDVLCPFCYIGKRRLEFAIQQFPLKNSLTIEWKSFQLNPYLKTNTLRTVFEQLAEEKGWTLEYATQMHQYVTDLAATVGITFNFYQAVVANSFDAHCLLQLAKSEGVGGEVKEALFNAYFCEGINIADREELYTLGVESGMKAATIQSAFEDPLYSSRIQEDIAEAAKLGIRAVPHFVFDQTYSISGAQDIRVFESVLAQTIQSKNA
jgi:predicted DsbA family dithiol-disulfide isomerase